MSSNPLISPRLGFRWNLDDSNKFILRGGFGVFTGRIPFVWLSNNFSNTGIQLSTYNVYGSSLMNADGKIMTQHKTNGKWDGTYTTTNNDGTLNNMTPILNDLDQTANISKLSASGS